jgi:hypothetical protein
MQQPLFPYFTPSINQGMLPPAKLIAAILTCHVGPLDNHVDKLITLMEFPDCSKETRSETWRLIQECGVPADQILSQASINVLKLKCKAKLALQLPPEERDQYLLLLSLNSFGALEIALDVIKEKLVDEKIAELILKGALIEKREVKRVTAAQAQKFANYWSMLSRKKMRAETVIKYGKAVIEALGNEKFKQLFSWFPVAVARRVDYVNDILPAPKQKALSAEELNKFIGEFAIIKELDLPMDRVGVAKLSEAISNPDVIAILEYENQAALIKAAASLL